jgi:hypothetical protein
MATQMHFARVPLPASVLSGALLSCAIGACASSDAGNPPSQVTTATATATATETPETPAPQPPSPEPNVDGGGADSSNTDGGSPSMATPPVPCGATLPGEPMRAGLLEGQPGYPEALASTDINDVPDPYSYTKERALGRGLINFMLERNTGNILARKDASTTMGQAVLAAAAKGSDGVVDFSFLRRGLHYFYPCTRPLPASLTVLRDRYGEYTAWDNFEVACAKPKNGPRRIYENHDVGVYVAETIAANTVRETEVIFSKTRTDGQLDFAVYTSNGEFTDRSTFATGNGGKVTSAAPYTCMSCHIEAASGRFTVRFPTGTGAGCR